MAHYASGSGPISAQQDALKTPPSKKPSAYVFDSNGDTRIILSTYIAQSFKWEADKIWIEQEKPTWPNFKTTNWGKMKDCSKVTLGDMMNAPFIFPEYSDGDEADPGFDDPVPSPERTGILVQDWDSDPPPPPDLTSLQVQKWDYGESSELSLEKTEFRMLVSGKHLELASPIFKTMLTGLFTEGNADSSGVRLVTASDWDPEAFKIVLTIMHGYHRDVPRPLTLELLAKVAMVVNYYDCLESVEVYTYMWLEAFESELPVVYGRDCMLHLFISWVFSRPTMFHSMTQLALRHSQRLIEVENFPLPADIIEAIDIARQNALAEIFSAVYELFDRLQEKDECSIECSSMLLGIMTKELKRHGILYPRSAPPYNGFSIDGLTKMIRELERPTWYHDSNYHSLHVCCVQNKLDIPLAKVESSLHVFNLQDFQSVKNHRRD